MYELLQLPIYFWFIKKYFYFSLGAIHPNAYEAYQTSHNLKTVVDKTFCSNMSKIVHDKSSKINIKLSLLTPILPMLVSFCLQINVHIWLLKFFYLRLKHVKILMTFLKNALMVYIQKLNMMVNAYNCIKVKKNLNFFQEV